MHDHQSQALKLMIPATHSPYASPLPHSPLTPNTARAFFPPAVNIYASNAWKQRLTGVCGNFDGVTETGTQIDQTNLVTTYAISENVITSMVVWRTL